MYKLILIKDDITQTEISNISDLITTIQTLCDVSGVTLYSTDAINNWNNGDVPTTIKQAIDQLALRLKTIETMMGLSNTGGVEGAGGGGGLDPSSGM